MDDLEEWRPVVGLEARYAVSDQGHLWSLRHNCRIRPEISRVKGRRTGYWRVTLWGGREIGRRRVCVHVLVLRAFIGPRPSDEHQAARPAGLEGAHLDGDTNNNALSNLVWATSKENHRHRVLHGHTSVGEKNNLVKAPDTIVHAVIEAVAGGMSRRQAARVYGVGAQTACDWVSGHRRPYIQRAREGT